jgi:hypothetical protein
LNVGMVSLAAGLQAATDSLFCKEAWRRDARQPLGEPMSNMWGNSAV